MIVGHRLLLLLPGDGDGSLAEAVLELPPDDGEGAHPAGAGGAAPLGLDGPVVLPDPGAGVAAGGAGVLLNVVRHLAAATAQGVRLVAALTKRCCALRLQ